MVATVQRNKDAPQILAGLPDHGPLTWEQLAPIMERLIRALPLTLSVEDLTAQEIPGGLHLQR